MIDWEWGNEHRLTRALGSIDDATVVDNLLDALDLVLDDPYGPAGLVVYRMKGTADHVDRWIAELPHGWVLTYTPLPDGAPPIRGPLVMVRDLRRVSID